MKDETGIPKIVHLTPRSRYYFEDPSCRYELMTLDQICERYNLTEKEIKELRKAMKPSFIKYLWDTPLKLFLLFTVIAGVVFPLVWSKQAIGLGIDGALTWYILGGIWTLIIVINYFKWRKL